MFFYEEAKLDKLFSIIEYTILKIAKQKNIVLIVVKAILGTRINEK